MIDYDRMDESFLAVCDALGSMVTCTHRQVGAIVVSMGQIKGQGWARPPFYNHNDKLTCIQGGCARGLLPPGEGEPDYSDCITVHAEIHALISAGSESCCGGTMYVNSEPCFMCKRTVFGADMYQIIYRNGAGDVKTILSMEYQNSFPPKR